MDDPGPDLIHEASTEQLEALVETMYLVAFSDGEFSHLERSHFAAAVAELTDGRLSGNGFQHVIDRVGTRLRNDGLEACLADLAQRLPSQNLREAAMILASDMAAADGVLHPGEQRLLRGLATAFELPPSSTREVTEGLTEQSPGAPVTPTTLDAP
jgi:tellurite resistance protein